MFQITDGRMEILAARLDFSLADCRGAGPQGSSQKALCEAEHSPPPIRGKSPGKSGPTLLEQHSHEEFYEALTTQTEQTSQM